MTTLDAVASLVTAIVALIALIAGYIQFVVRRALLPAVEFDVEFAVTHRGPTQLIGEPTLVIRNVGTNTLIVTNVRCRVRYRLSSDPEERRPDGIQPELAHKLPEFFIAEKRTFVQPGVCQRYRQAVALPATTQVVDLLGGFDYRIRIGPVTKYIVGLFVRPQDDLDWRRGITNHTSRRVVAVPSDDEAR
jgi:hypothetical protein